MVARNRVVISGSLGSPAVERWSIGIHTTQPGGGAITNLGDLQQWADTVATALDGGELSMPELTEALSNFGDADTVSIYAYGPTGPAIAQAEATFAWSGNGVPYAHFPSSLVCSLYTDVAGRSRRGRFYFPALGLPLQGGGGIAGVADLADDFVTLLGIVCANGTPDPAQAQVYSPTQNLVTPVTSIRVGNVLDTQRRRRDAIQETYTTRAILP